MSIFRWVKNHLFLNPFIGFTGLAALSHSTWSIGVLFSGTPPTIAEGEHWLVFVIRAVIWWLPAFGVAFSFDIGQIETSKEIREARQSGLPAGAWRIATFIIFAVATYLLQWIYLAHHMPLLSLGAGVTPTHQAVATTLRDLMVWILPAFLPLSTLLYTVSSAASHIAATPETPTNAPTLHDAPPVATDTPVAAPTITVTPAPPAELPAPMTAQDVGLPAAQPTSVTVPRKRKKPTIDMSAAPSLFDDVQP